MARVQIDRVPSLARPPEVERAITEAVELRDRLRQANEQLATAEAEYERQQNDDVAHAADRARKGSPLGAIPAAFEKARHEVDVKKRTAAALSLASQAAQDDVGSTILACADPWRSELNAEVERAREDGLKAIERLRDACARIGDGLAIRGWVESGVEGGGVFDHLATGVWTASVAPSSRRRTANSEALTATELFAYLGELVEPPAPAPTGPILGGRPTPPR
jgi:hypothetical protein